MEGAIWRSISAYDVEIETWMLMKRVNQFLQQNTQQVLLPWDTAAAQMADLPSDLLISLLLLRQHSQLQK